ncbi:MAG: metallophosphoesterase, partial [Clostridia bacterium]|nr:metallophosphoesterase [Clostridia bacterium]
MKRTLSLVLAFVLVFLVTPVSFRDVSAESAHTVVIASSDFQGDTDADSASQLAAILAKVREDYPSADGYLHCGDYTVILQYIASQSESGIAALLQTINDSGLGIPASNIVLDQGNHDPVGTGGLSDFGDNDPESGKYGVFVIREDNYMWFSGYQGNDGTQIVSEHEPTVQDTAQRLRSYLLAKAAEGFSAPIFVLSHVPLHYSMRTYVYGDSRYAHYLTDVLNEGAALGLNIVFLFGHNHSQGWDNYLGASCVYLPRGSKMKISASDSNTSCVDVNIGFTYMNAGYTGYYRTDCGEDIDDTLTVSVFDITDDSVEIRRYSASGQHDLKSIGVANEKIFGGVSESSLGLYSPNTSTVPSPQTLYLSPEADPDAVRITSPEDLISFLSECAGGNTFSDKRVVLTNDIVINSGDSSTWASSPPSVNLASLYGTNGRFAGVFDGQGHTISGLYIDRLSSAGAMDAITGVGTVAYGSTSEYASGYAALFPRTGSCTIRNLHITNSYFAGTYATGALIGCAYGDTSVENVLIDDSAVFATYKQIGNPSGGDSGLYEKHCSSGGVVGMTNSDYTLNFTNVLYQGSVTGFGRFVGGICGNMQKSHLVLDSVGFIGNVVSRYGDVYTGSYLYKENSGGLIGRFSDNINTSSGAVISKSFFIGTLNANASSTTSGLVAGRCDICTISEFYANTGAYPSFLGQTNCTDRNALAYCVLAARSVLESEGAAALIGLNPGVWVDKAGIGPVLSLNSSDPEPVSDKVSIGTAEELLSFFIDCNTNGLSFAGKTVLLTDDITFNTGDSSAWA